MHRSGTSGVTRLLNLAGAWFGPEGIATEANEENPRGFWERRDVREVCDGLLHDAGFDWWRLTGFDARGLPQGSQRRWSAVFRDIVDELEPHRPWVMKEPRLCTLLPVLRPLLTAPVCIHVTREPLEVARSVHRRNQLPVEGGLALWELYTVRALEASEELPRVLVRYEDLMRDPVGCTERLVADLEAVGVEGLHPVPAAQVEAFITRTLHHQRAEAADRTGWLNEHQARLAARIDEGSVLGPEAVGPVSPGALEALAELERRGELVAQVERIEQIEHDLAAAERHRDTEVARRRELGRLSEDALTTLDTQLERVEQSRVGRVADLLLATRQRLGRSSARPGHLLDHPRRELAGRRTEIQARARQDPAPGGASDVTFATDHPLIRRTRPRHASDPTDRRSVAVLAWDVGHNPLGRANVLAEVLARHFDVELWGAQFDRYGSHVWAPLRRAQTPVNVFPGRAFPEHLPTMEAVAAEIEADAVWVSKPRLPSYLLGILAKQSRNRPLVLDVDDHELAFFAEDRSLDLSELLGRSRPDDLEWPFERAWTRACDGFIDAADQVTVSNVALQERYGGLLVPHARDEHHFDPAQVDREEVRHRLGVEPEERLLLFGGTPRAHKGVVEVLEALEWLGDDRYRVLVFGTREFEEMRGRLGPLAKWARVLPAQSFDELPELVAAADLACVIQDPTHPVSRYQMPAKVSDALAMAVPCLVTPTPPLAPLVDEGVLQVLEPGDVLHERIAGIFDDHDDARARATRGRSVFLRDLSYEAVARSVVPLFEGLMDDPPDVTERLTELADAPARAFAGAPGVRRVRVHPERLPRRRAREVAPLRPGTTFDVAMFWKQNDSGIYGRRQDMFLEELARTDRIGIIVHFDNPISPEALAEAYRAGRGRASDQRALVARETVARVLRRRDEGDVHRHTFVFGGRYTRRLGRPARAEYPAYAQGVLASYGIGAHRPLLIWAYPSNDDLPDLVDALDPAIVVADVVDDNRTWYEPDSPFVAKIERNYQAVLARSDLVLANCEPVAAAMARFAEEVHVVPNGCEMPHDQSRGAAAPVPTALRGLTGPVIAYVGNLSARLDVDLLEAVARARPQWNLVLVGSAHLDQSVLALERLPNVSFPGVLPYRQVHDLLAHVDVGLIPHVDNEMTRSMNPLKAFVYVAAGVPVVSTPVANLADFGGLITVASDAEGFVAAIERHLDAGRPTVDPELLRPHSWTARVEQVIALIDEQVIGPA